MEIVMELTGCGPLEAASALAQHKDVVLAVDALLTKPVVSGEKYIPKRPSVHPGMDEEQKERCDKGRWLQDQVNAVFSVAHSQNPPGPAALEAPTPLGQLEPPAPSVSEAQLPSMTSLPRDFDEKSPQSALRSESLQ